MPDELEIENGRIYLKETPDRGMPVKDLFWAGDMVPILATVNGTLPEKVTGIPFAATFAEVEVDTETGKVAVLKLVVVNDLGTVMCASGAEAQQVGGQCMGLGETLTEEIIYDKATGIPLNFNWIDYKIPTMADFPDVEPVPLEVWRGAAEYGACGLGEGITTCTPRAVANAIYNAIAARIDDIPFKPEKILRVLGKT
jgi:CO/xanthine dehydrogenase Mo-binding subunit